jgi:hypothetical protein
MAVPTGNTHLRELVIHVTREMQVRARASGECPRICNQVRVSKQIEPEGEGRVNLRQGTT